MNFVTKSICLFSVFCSLIVNIGHGQASLNDQIVETSIYSQYLQEERNILWYNTGTSGQAKNDLPTIYLIDGKVNFLLVAGILSNLVRSDLVPPLNLIGINTYDYERNYDLTPKATSDEIYFETGGYENFKKFLCEELSAYADTSISSSKYRILIGHSLGGSFGMNLLLEIDDIFSSAILIDPSLWWNDAELIMLARSNPIAKTNIWFTRSGTDMENNALFDSLNMVLDTGNHNFIRLPGENHVSVLTPSIFQSIKEIFGEFGLLEAKYELDSFQVKKRYIDYLSSLYDTNIVPDARILAPQARTSTRNGQYDQAIEILTYLREYHQQNIMVLNFLGEAYQKSGDKENARITYQQSLVVAKSKKSPMIRWIEKRLAELEN